jgi:hypothetical protein
MNALSHIAINADDVPASLSRRAGGGPSSSMA